jgi:hypothetical protein
VSAARDRRGDVLVLWGASATPDVVYKVSRRRPDGSWQVLARVTGTSLDDGGAPAGVEAPIYAVAALQAGRSSPLTRSDGPVLTPTPQSAPPTAASAAAATAAATPAPAAPRPPSSTSTSPMEAFRPREVRAVRLPGGSVEISWTGPVGAQFRVRAQTGPESWRVVGRTTGTSIEDGGAPSAAIPVYAVSATVGEIRSYEGRSDE